MDRVEQQIRKNLSLVFVITPTLREWVRKKEIWKEKVDLSREVVLFQPVRLGFLSELLRALAIYVFMTDDKVTGRIKQQSHIRDQTTQQHHISFHCILRNITDTSDMIAAFLNV